MVIELSVGLLDIGMSLRLMNIWPTHTDLWTSVCPKEFIKILKAYKP